MEKKQTTTTTRREYTESERLYAARVRRDARRRAGISAAMHNLRGTP